MSIAAHCPNLNTLDFSHCAGITDPLEIQLMCRKLTKLVSVNLSYCDRLFGNYNWRDVGTISSVSSLFLRNSPFRIFDLRRFSDDPPRKVDSRFQWVSRLDKERYCKISERLEEFRAFKI